MAAQDDDLVAVDRVARHRRVELDDLVAVVHVTPVIAFISGAGVIRRHAPGYNPSG